MECTLKEICDKITGNNWITFNKRINDLSDKIVVSCVKSPTSERYEILLKDVKNGVVLQEITKNADKKKTDKKYKVWG